MYSLINFADEKCGINFEKVLYAPPKTRGLLKLNREEEIVGITLSKKL